MSNMLANMSSEKVVSQPWLSFNKAAASQTSSRLCYLVVLLSRVDSSQLQLKVKCNEIRTIFLLLKILFKNISHTNRKQNQLLS